MGIQSKETVDINRQKTFIIIAGTLGFLLFSSLSSIPFHPGTFMIAFFPSLIFQAILFLLIFIPYRRISLAAKGTKIGLGFASLALIFPIMHVIVNPHEGAQYDYQQNIPGFILIIGILTSLFSIKIIQDLLEETRIWNKQLTDSSQ